MPRLFALDHNFPQPIVDALVDFQVEAELVRVDQIDPRMPDLDDWELLLALHHHSRDWDGLITTDSSMLRQAREVAVLMQTRLTLVVALASGHDPVKACGLLFAYLAGICKRTEPTKPQVWKLNAADRAGEDAWTFMRQVAEHQNRDATAVWNESRLDDELFAADPLAG